MDKDNPQAGTGLAQQSAAPTADMLLVTDLTATPTNPKRIHHLLYNGVMREVVFEMGRPAPLPVDLALRFLKDEAFVVTDTNGNKYDPTPKAPDAATAGFTLAPGEVVAKLEELTAEALFIRAKQLPGSEKLTKSTAKDKLCAFLANAALSNLPQGKDDPEEAEEELLDKLLPKDAEASGV